MELRLNLRGTTWETNDSLFVSYDGVNSLLDPAFFVSGPFTPVYSEFFSTYIVGPAWDNPADTPYDYDFFFDLSGLPDPRGIAALTLVWLWFYNSVDAVVSARESEPVRGWSWARARTTRT